jgi:hypothetical protein
MFRRTLGHWRDKLQKKTFQAKGTESSKALKQEKA